MKAFDTDILSLVLLGNATHRQRFEAVAKADRFVTVVTCEEILRGRLDAIRQAQKQGDKLSQKYELLENSLEQINGLKVLTYTPAAHDLFLS